MVQREYHSRRINAVLNDPSVLPWVALREQPRPLDLGPLLRDLRNILLVTEDGLGGCFFHWQEPGVYEVHIQFLPAVRGKSALAAVNASLHWMFTASDCMELLTAIPQANESARMMAQLIHGRHEFTEGEFNGSPVEHWALRYNDWLWTAPGLRQRGEEFHRGLEAEFAAAGLEHAAHAESSDHNRAVGATVAMVLAGQVDKGIILMARWARTAGYAMPAIVSRSPLVIDIGEPAGLIAVEAQSFRVVPRS